MVGKIPRIHFFCPLDSPFPLPAFGWNLLPFAFLSRVRKWCGVNFSFSRFCMKIPSFLRWIYFSFLAPKLLRQASANWIFFALSLTTILLLPSKWCPTIEDFFYSAAGKCSESIGNIWCFPGWQLTNKFLQPGFARTTLPGGWLLLCCLVEFCYCHTLESRQLSDPWGRYSAESTERGARGVQYAAASFPVLFSKQWSASYRYLNTAPERFASDCEGTIN